jgi:hypothetical protein
MGTLCCRKPPAIGQNQPLIGLNSQKFRLDGGGGIVANLISHAVDHQLKDGKVSTVELFDILIDYLRKPGFARRYAEDPHNYDFWGQHSDREALNALGELVPKVPGLLSRALIENLPVSRYPGIPRNVLEVMNDWQLEALLSRHDVDLAELRHRKFLAIESNNESDLENDGLRSAAICCNFHLTNEEFATIRGCPALC